MAFRDGIVGGLGYGVRFRDEPVKLALIFA